jgi:hypothetical protein
MLPAGLPAIAENLFKASYTRAGFAPEIFQNRIRQQTEHWKCAESVKTRLELVQSTIESHFVPDQNIGRRPNQEPCIFAPPAIKSNAKRASPNGTS